MPSPRKKFVALLRVLLTLVLSVSVLAQSATTGSLSGIVTDSTGAVIPGATITLTNTATGATRTVTSDEEGRWRAPALDIGIYRATVEANGFKKGNLESIAVEASVPRTLEIKLETGALNEVVNITDAAPLLTPETATTFRQLNAEELTKVPTGTRSFTHLLSAEAGISSDLPPVLTNSNGNISPSVNGTRTTSTSLSFNGVDATNITTNEGSFSDNISPAPETLQEVKLQTSLYDASTGRSGGGNFQLITKSGGNTFNGTLYHYLQNEKLNANDFFFNKDGVDRPKARRNEGGGTIGGPIRKDKTFFFGGYQFTRANTGFVPTASSVTTLPEALRLIPGDATAANVVAAFRQLNPQFQLTEAQISPIALRLLNIRNPVTGGYLVARPRANAVPLFSGTSRVVDTNVGDLTRLNPVLGDFRGGNPLVRQRNVQPAQFQQDQFTVRLDEQLTQNNRLSGTVFFADFPGLDPFPNPLQNASPVTIRRAARNTTVAISDIQNFGTSIINEARFGLFRLNNTRRLDDPFLNITNESVGIPNPATFFDNSPGTQRLGHYVWRNALSGLDFGGPNDSFNKRKQESWSVADTMTWLRGAHTFKFGGEFKRHAFDTNLPEEQATEFEKFENFTQFLAGYATEADTQFGVTDKRFRFMDLNGFITDDWRVSNKLTLNAGVRWEWFGWPTEMDGRIGNVDLSLLTNPNNPVNVFTVPNNVKNTGFQAVDGSIAASTKINNKHTLNGQDLNNFAPRFGFAFNPFSNNKLVVRGGYGVFFDRPSAAFINTVFSNYPFLRENEVTAPSRAIPLDKAWSAQNVNQPFAQYLPNRIVYQSGGTFVIRDGTGITRDAQGNVNPIDLATGQPALGNVAETFEFRAVDRDLRTPYVQQWNLGFQFEVAKDMMFEVRYVGTKGTKLLQAIALNQGYDLNDPSAPDFIFGRFNDAYNAAYQRELTRTGNVNVLNGPLRTASTQRERGRGIAFGFANPYLVSSANPCSTGALVLPANTPTDFNMSQALRCTGTSPTGGAIIGFEARVPVLGFNVPEALLLQSAGNSSYHGLQMNLSKRMSRGLQYNLAYTWSKSLDYLSSDPGSTAGSGRPDIPNTGFITQGDSRNVRANRAPSDFDRTHRFSASFVYELPFGQTRFLSGWALSGFFQTQTGTPFSIFAGEPEIANVTQYRNLFRGSGGLVRPGFGRPNLNGTLDQLRQGGSDKTEQYFNASVLTSSLGGFGNLGRNVLRAPSQSRFDIGISKVTKLTERVNLEFRWDVFNLFNRANFAAPNTELSDDADFNRITNTIGGPRVMQVGAKLRF